MPGDLLHTFRRALYSRTVLVGSILICAFLFFQLVQVVTRSASTGKEIASLKSEVESLQTEQKRLEQLRSFLQTDFFAEQEARTKFGLQKEGEHALILSSPNGSARNELSDVSRSRGNEQGASRSSDQDTHANASGTAAKQDKNYHRWWYYFFGRE